MFLCLAATFWAVFGGVFLCTPVGKLWKPDTPGWCMNAEDYWISAAAINVVLDFAVLILPLPVVSRLRLPKSQKIALLLVFLVGGFGSIVSIVRLSIVHVEAREGHYLESGVAAITWSAVEANTGIICASLLALKPWLVRFFPRLLSPKEPASQCMRLPTIPYTENSTVDSEATLAVLNRPNLSQQTVVIDFAQELAPAFVVKRPSL
ncbi:MAG: hypothetical protein M1820_001541 [Bogoriella megaspora]|nr:MAG: hypothetical protein M1820_001541 [Bogoriella megaspora]